MGKKAGEGRSWSKVAEVFSHTQSIMIILIMILILIIILIMILILIIIMIISILERVGLGPRWRKYSPTLKL